MPWIGAHPVLDLGNTVVFGAGPARGDVDPPADPEPRASWRGHAADRALADLSLEELTELRDPVRAVLDAAARQTPLPEAARRRLNDLAAWRPCHLPSGGERPARGEGGSGPAAGATTRQALVLAAGPERSTLRRCPAPGCGMFFLPRRRDQTWCSTSCGDRASPARRQHPRTD
ncbi:ABATE domain-containing protein [Streptomyces gobitricini]|uniref:ABATE domain-containing protein n=1 Tax=Streptomyces gobitricini TaxID=68211 RepID=UPI0031DD4BF1